MSPRVTNLHSSRLSGCVGSERILPGASASGGSFNKPWTDLGGELWLSDVLSQHAATSWEEVGPRM